MPDKIHIFDNIHEYTAIQLYEYIRQGLMTFDELLKETEGRLSYLVRKDIQRLLSENSPQDPTDDEEADWLLAQSRNTQDAYLEYLRKHPDKRHADEARDAIKNLDSTSHVITEDDLEDVYVDVRSNGIFDQSQNRLIPWESVDKSSIADLRRFIETHPEDIEHIREANILLNNLAFREFNTADNGSIVDRINGIQTNPNILDPDSEILNVIIDRINRRSLSLKEILALVREDNNLLRPSVLKGLIDKGLMSYHDLMGIGIDRRFIELLANGVPIIDFPMPIPLTGISKVSTEVYFWGIPSSGKSCAIGAILSVANNGRVAYSMHKNDCQGYGYMTRLSTLFQSDGRAGSLPEGTPIYSTYEMAFDLVDNDNKVHPLTFIDLAGELVRCMYKYDAHEPMSDDELNALQTLTNVLVSNRSTNRKIHFFVLEYGGENRKYEGLTQSEYLDAALHYIERTKILQRETDAIYLMITKVDKTGLEGKPMIDELVRYIDNNYLNFYQGLQHICHKNDINGGNVERLPFSLGQVCFQDYCIFDERYAANVVRLLMHRTKGYSTSKLKKGLNKLKG